MKKLNLVFKVLKKKDNELKAVEKQIKPLEKKRRILQTQIRSIWIKNFGVADHETLSARGLVECILKTVKSLEKDV